jgi:hypothetical protein
MDRRVTTAIVLTALATLLAACSNPTSPDAQNQASQAPACGGVTLGSNSHC